MYKFDYIRVIIPQTFDFKMYGIETEESKQKFLQKMCDESVNAPIVKDDNAIGIIIESKVSKTGTGIISYGMVWSKVETELMRNDKKEYSYSCAVLNGRL